MERGWWHLTEDGPHEDDWRDPQLFRVLAKRSSTGTLPAGARDALSIFGVTLTEVLPSYFEEGSAGKDGKPASDARVPREHARP
jgi:hypothetical protein